MRPCRIALHGYARTGKDTFGLMLMRLLDLKRVALGDIIKRQLDPIVKIHLGFSAFTQDDKQKTQIRPTLVEWGYANYDNILREFMEDVPARAVSTRIFRLEECLAWRQAGGIIVELKRLGIAPAETKEAMELERCRVAGFIDLTIDNNGTIDDLEKEAIQLAFEIGRGNYPGQETL